MRQNVGSYEIVRVLARGGMAIVYLAHQPALDRDVALKQLDLQGTDPMLAQRFVREARLAAGLDHPNIVTLFDFFQDAGVPYIAMEYVGAGSLRPLVGALTLPQVFGILEGMLAGLAHAEAKSISHRDLKPENVLMTRGGTVKLADFGIARAYDALTPSFTSTGTTIGTPAYMAPEQALDEPLGPATDIYALGVVAYELLSGRPPFEPGRTPMAVLYCHIHKPPPPLAELAPDVPEAVCRWVEWMLAKRPDDRPASAAEAWESLEEIAVAELGPYWRRAAAIAPPEERDEDHTTLVDIPDQATPISMSDPPEPRRRRLRRLAAIAAGALLVVATAGAAVWATGSDPPPRTAQPKDKAASPPPPPHAAQPYDFDGDGRQEAAIGLPNSGKSHAGTVIVQGGKGAAPSSNAVVTPASVRLGRLTGDEGFGTSVASGDFDGDGHADLATSAPGRDLVLIVHGTDHGLSRGHVERIEATEMRALAASGDYGSRLLAANMNGDRFSDLVIGVPGADLAGSGSGLIQILFGGEKRIRTDNPTTVNRPVDDWARFGEKLRAGDVNGDGIVDLVEGAPDRPDEFATGHLSFCAGKRSGRPRPCEAIDNSAGTGTSALAIADVNGDKFEDVIQGDAVPEPGIAPLGGQVRIWRGSRHGPTGEPLVVVQGEDFIPGADEPDDNFGAGVDSGRLDSDRYADIVVTAPGEQSGAGGLIVVRGGRDGIARTGHAGFSMGVGVPGDGLAGRRLGWSVAVLELSGDKRLDVAAGVRGADRIQESVYVIEGPRRGNFAPNETKSWPLLRGPVRVRDADSRRLRLGRMDGA